MENVAIHEANRLAHLSNQDEQALIQSFFKFLDGATTATGRATFYNSKKEQEVALNQLHQNLFEKERGIYGLAMLLPGVTDYSIQLGITNLLGKGLNQGSILNAKQEQILIKHLATQLPAPRMLKLFIRFRQLRRNNARTRKLILGSILNSKRIELWSVRYRRKMATALTHAWGLRTTGILFSILKKETISDKEVMILDRHIFSFVKNKKLVNRVAECIGFVLGNEKKLNLPLLSAYVEAKTNLNKGVKLPYEVLEGIRSVYHKDTPNEAVLDLTKNNLTKGQKIGFQRKAETEKVEVAFNPMHYDAVKLYIYAFERGLSENIQHALQLKAEKTAARLPIQFGNVAILVDNSASMQGVGEQALRPMAVALATKDALVAASESAKVSFMNSVQSTQDLPMPYGDTSMAMQVLNMLKSGVDTLFIISDGYENSPSGRVDEIIRLARKIGVNTPVFQVTPVMAAESGGLRALSDLITVMPVSKPEAMALGMLKASFEINLENGVLALMKTTMPVLDN